MYSHHLACIFPWVIEGDLLFAVMRDVLRKIGLFIVRVLNSDVLRVSFKNVSKCGAIEASFSKYCMGLFLCSARGDALGQAGKHSSVIMMYVVITLLLHVTMHFL